MSKTFTSRPSAIAKGRGASNSRGRIAQFGETRSQGRIEREATSDRDTTTSSSRPSDRPIPKARVSGRGRGRNHSEQMDNPGYPSRQTSGAYGDSNPKRNDGNPESGTEPGQGSHSAGGYTVFSPNEKKRQQIREMAQRETQAYEQYRKANAPKNFSFVGTVGGGETDQDQVRARQANSVRAQKFNRQMRQQEAREARKMAEEREIQEKKAEARRKAEQNNVRSLQRHAPAEEVRRKREAFLRQLETKSLENKPSPLLPSRSTLLQTDSPALQSKLQPPQVKTAPTDVPSQSSAEKVISKSFTDRRLSDRRSVSSENKTPMLRQPSSEPIKPSEVGPYEAGHRAEVYDDLTTLTSMFPDHDPSYLSDLLFQLGSVDKVINLFDVAG